MRIGDWVDTLPNGPESSPDPDDEPATVRAELESVAADLRSRVARLSSPPDLPFVLTKATLMDIHRCEGLAWARSGTAGAMDDSAMVLGSALDAFVGHVIAAGEVADPASDLGSYWDAQGRDDNVEALRHLDPGSDPALARRLADLAAGAGEVVVDPLWAPRVEVAMGASFGAVLALRGRVDLLLGGPGTGRGAAVVEVKSGSPHPSQHAEVQHYILLAALRHGAMPIGAGVWYPDGTFTPIHVPGSAASAAARVADAAVALVEMWEGRDPRLSPAAHCGWCPLGDTCPRAGT